MTVLDALLVGLGGSVGAVLRVAAGEMVAGRDWPAGTFLVNVVGTFVLGLLTFAGVGDDAMLLVGTGACGSFTTFSSFSFDTVRAWETGDRRLAVGYASGTLLAAGVALGAAWVVAGAV